MIKKCGVCNYKKESAEDSKWPLEIDMCAGIIELAKRFTISAVFSLSVVTGIDILDISSLCS
jgi:hypothetical protein